MHELTILFVVMHVLSCYRGCGSSTASSNGAAYRSHTPATKDDETRDAVTESLPMKKSIPLAQTANTTGTGAARSSVTNSTAHQMDRRAERSHISLTASKNGSIPEEAMSEQDMQMYEQLVIDANPAPLVLHPPNTYNPPPVDIQTVAMRSIDTAAHVADVANGGYVLLSHKAEEMIAASVTDSVAHAASLSDEEDNSAGVVNILRVLDRIFAVWNTKPQIPHLHFDPSIQRGSIIGGQTGFISPLTTPTNKSNNPMGTPKNSATPAGSLLSPFSLGGGVASNSTAQTKTDPKPVYVGEYIAFLKVWEAELVRDHAQYALPANRQYLAAALESAGALENIISMAITRGTFLKHMYVAQDQYLLSTHRFDAIRNLRDRVKVAAGRGAQDISEAEVELSKRFTTYSEALETQTLFQTALQPLDFSLDITTELNRYIQGTRLTVCRAFWQWVHVNTAMPSYEEELAEQAGSLIRASAAMLLRRVFWIKGSAGVGKTNQSALLAELFHEQILAVHFVKHDYEERKNPIRMIRNIAYQLSQRIPEYSKELKKRLEKIAANTASGGAGSAVLHHPIASPAHASSPTNASTANASANGSADKDAAVGLPILASPSAYLDSLSALDLFDQLLTQPLQAIKQPASIAKDKKMVILVDAIDEAERESTSSSSRRRMEGKTPAAATDESESGNENLLLKILLQQVQLLPTWVGLCLTSRSNEQIVQALSKSRPTEISCDSRDNLSDLRKIVTTMLQPVVAASELEEAVEIVVKKSEGTILYIRLVLDDRLSKLHQGHFDRSQAALPETVGSATLGGSKPSTPPANASHANSGGSGGGLGSPNSPVIDAAVANGENPPMMTLADIKAFPEGLHAYYAEALEGVAAFLAQYKQPLSHVMQIVQLLVCSMEPLTPSLLAQLQYGPSGAPTTGSVASFAKEKGETLIIRTLNPLRALFPYRLLDATRACRGKYSIVHKSLRDYLVDSSRLEKRKESSFHVSLRQGHSRLAERCWHALQAPMSAAEGEPGQAIPKSILSEPFGAAQSRDEALQKQNQANGGAELPPSLVPVHAPFLRLDDVLLGNHPCPSSSDDESAASEAVEGVAPEDAYTKGPERDGVLSYAIRHGPAHAIQSDDLCGTASFLCHLQYLHLRVALGEASLLSLDYINAARQINSRARGWTAEKRLDVPSAASRHVSAAGATSGKNADLKQANWVWLQPMDSASGIINFQCFFQQELPHWLGNKELIYQYALAFPDDTLVCRVARSLMSWYLNAWSGRKMGLVHWNNKPQALGALMITLRGHQASVQALSYSPDGRTLASASFDRSIRLWNAETGELRTELKGHGYHINTVAYSPDGKRIASGGSDNQIRLWDTATNECIRVLQGDDVWFNSVQFSPDGKKLACGVSDWAVWIFDLSTFEVEMKLEGHKDKIYSVCYSPDGKLIASGSEDETIRLWASSSGKLVHEIKEGHSKGVLAVQFDVDGVRMLSSGLDGVVRLWSCEDWSLLQEFKGHEKGAYGVAFHPDQIRVISASYDRKVKIWNSLNGQLLHTLHGHAEEVNAVVVSPNGARIASCSADRSIMLWDSQLEVTVSSLAQASCEGKSHTGSIYSINASADGKQLVSCGEDKMLKVWSMDGDLLCELKGHKEGVLAATFLNDGTRIASGSTDSTIRFWNVQTGKEEADLKVKDKTGFVWTLVASPNGKQLVSGSTDANLRVWNANDGSLIRIIKGPKGMIYSVAYSTDGKRLVCGSETKVVRVYDADSGDLKMELAGHTGDIHSVCFSPDNKIIASGSYDKSIGIWDATTGKSIRYLQGHTGWVNSIAISPNNKYLVSGGADATIRVWSLATGEQVSILTGHSDSVLFVKFSADGSQILSTGKHRDQTFRVWKFAPDEPSAAAAAAALTSAISPVHTNGFSSNAHVPVSVPIGANMAKNFDFRTDKGSLVAGCLQVSCHT